MFDMTNMSCFAPRYCHAEPRLALSRPAHVMHQAVWSICCCCALLQTLQRGKWPCIMQFTQYNSLSSYLFVGQLLNSQPTIAATEPVQKQLCFVPSVFSDASLEAQIQTCEPFLLLLPSPQTPTAAPRTKSLTLT